MGDEIARRSSANFIGDRYEEAVGDYLMASMFGNNAGGAPAKHMSEVEWISSRNGIFEIVRCFDTAGVAYSSRTY